MPTTEPMEGTPGVSGSNVELHRGTTHLQWRMAGSSTWLDLIAWADLKGDQGVQGAPGVDGDDGDDARRVVVATANTNASGDATFTFSPPFATAPHIDATITIQTNVNWKLRLTAVSASGCTVRVESQDQAFLSLLGLNILSAAVTAVSGATVSITATER